MNVTDSDWLAAFGTNSSEIEKPVKQRKPKLNRAQQEAGLIISKPELFGVEPSVKAQQTKS